MLLIIEALLFILAAVGQDHTTAEGQIFPLDLANNSVDDLYYGCKEKTAKQVESEYLKKELRNSDDFKKVWEIGKNKVSRNVFGKLKAKHKIAIYVYTYTQVNPKLQIYVKFNNDTRYGKQNYTIMKYEWHSLHFLLTEALYILKQNTQNRCYKTFRGTKVNYVGTLFTAVRFGSFTSSSLDRDSAKRFGTKSCFEIHTCEGADITKYSMLSHEKEVLIPPYEMFNVTGIKIRNKQNNLWCETVFKLNSAGIKSDLNCVLFNKPTQTIK